MFHVPCSRLPRLLATGACLVMICSACASDGKREEPVASPASSVGPHPELPAPDQKKIIPTVNVADATGWPPGMAPKPAEGLTVKAFATGLTHPRWLYVLPNGDVLVAETNAPDRPEEGKGIRAKVQKMLMAKAGAGVPSPDRITLLRDTDADGAADIRTVFIEGLHSPFGMALVGQDLYVANTDAIVKFAYPPGATHLAGPGTRLTDLPGGPINHHWTKNIIAGPDGGKLFATVGSNSNAGDRGIAAEAGRAAIYQVDLATGAKRLYATGIRNPNGMAWEPRTGALWAVVNERDELGNDLVPDYLTAVKQGAFYGWPYSYYGQHVDTRVKPPRPDLVAKAIVPDYALGAHVAALGLAWVGAGAKLGGLTNGMVVGEHGSWNREVPSGYRVVFVPFKDGEPAGDPRDVLTGFVSEHGEAWGRPVGVAIDRRGALLVADDVGNAVWRVMEAKAGS